MPRQFPKMKSTTLRFSRVDTLRGLAMVWMTVFHFCFDLNDFRYIKQDFYYDPLWTWQRNCIVGLFLFCAGLSQAVALQQAPSWQRFWRRWAQVVACALLVTAASYWKFPGSYIFFGVLHGIAAMLIVARLTAHWGNWLWLAGGLAIASKFIATYGLSTLAPAGFDINFMNQTPWNVLGWITRKPITEDYVPLAPWLGLVWWGMATGQWLLKHHAKWLAKPIPKAAKPVAWLGRWSLSYYMLHQPVMIGTFMAIAALK